MSPLNYLSIVAFVAISITTAISISYEMNTEEERRLMIDLICRNEKLILMTECHDPVIDALRKHTEEEKICDTLMLTY